MFADNVLLPSHFGNVDVDDETPKELERWVARYLQKKGVSLYRRVISQIEAEVIRQALEKCGYNKIKAARLLGINRNTLTKKVKEYSL